VRDSKLGRGDPATSVYVGIDMHRKRSQVAVVTGDGTVELNKNVVDGSDGDGAHSASPGAAGVSWARAVAMASSIRRSRGR
jgi:hypothetical protein